jgi:Family of unknown function (DUF5302)
MSDNTQDSGGSAATPDPADIKAQMKAALDRKHDKERAGEAHLNTSSRDGSTHGKEGTNRQFRRKAGG